MSSAPVFRAAPTPRTLWVELTSKCPADCIFCSRQLRRGAGQHLPFSVYESMVRELSDARRFILNYSGESTLYPELIPAIQQARSTGAFVELVSVLVTAPETLLGPLCESGLNRLTVSVHATNPEIFAEIYRYSSVETLQARLQRLMELCRSVPLPPVIDLAFVAMDRNLAELPSVVLLAERLGLNHLSIWPVMRRDDIPVQFPSELTTLGTHRPDYQERLRSAVDRASESHPEVKFTICNQSFTEQPQYLGQIPVSYPGPLPEGAHIHSCEQNPWETAHVLSNGDVVACEVLDRIPLGNLHEQTITQIWQGETYQQFRERYWRGQVPECRACPWKIAYRPSPLESEIIASRGFHAQLLQGWHQPRDEDHIWSSQRAVAILAPRLGSRELHVSGMLPPGPNGSQNEFVIRLNGTEIGKVTNPWEEVIPFGISFPVSEEAGLSWTVEFRTAHVYRPCERGTGGDQRDLGFALVLLVSKEFVDLDRTNQYKQQLMPLVRWVKAVDRCGLTLKPRRLGARPIDSKKQSGVGLSLIIPERDNLDELAACLASVRGAIDRWPEPIETIVVVNGVPESRYETLRRHHPEIRWLFYPKPLGFAGAIGAGMRHASYDWVYLLNNDAALDPSALLALAPYRSGKILSISSQILLKDPTRFRDETNWSTLLVDSGLATIHDWIPRSQDPVPTFYAGGGASLFQKRLLQRLLDAQTYDPFYWEDVEWGWRARKLGYDSVFCPASVVHHTQRSTINKYYSPAEIEVIVKRNRLLFQLRNFTTTGSISAVITELARSDSQMVRYFLQRRTLWRILRGRLWNHVAPISDEEVFDTWNSSISNC